MTSALYYISYIVPARQSAAPAPPRRAASATRHSWYYCSHSYCDIATRGIWWRRTIGRKIFTVTIFQHYQLGTNVYLVTIYHYYQNCPLLNIGIYQIAHNTLTWLIQPLLTDCLMPLAQRAGGLPMASLRLFMMSTHRSPRWWTLTVVSSSPVSLFSDHPRTISMTLVLSKINKSYLIQWEHYKNNMYYILRSAV